MLNYLISRTPEFYKSLPKVDLHRHLEGSLRFDTVRELARSHGLDLPPTGQLRGMVQIHDDEPYTFSNFLSKFATLRLFYRSPEIITRLARESIADAAADNVRYLELRFTPVALSRAQGFSLGQVMDWVIEGVRQAEQEFQITTRLIASVNRHEDVDLAAQVADLAADRIEQGVVGLDLAGDEVGFSAEPFAPVIKRARQNGLHVTIHAGEWNTGANVTQAIQLLGAERIGHGIRVLEDPQAVELAREQNIPFEVCISSNYQSGAISTLSEHPLRDMLQAGLYVTINTDDPSISQIELSDEYRLACESLGLSLEELSERVICAAQASFLPEIERQRLVQTLADDYAKILA